MNTLPAELILEIATHLEFTRDIAGLSQTYRALHHRLNARVYAHNCQHENGLGLEHAVTLNISSAVSKLLSHGAGRELPRPGFVRLLTETAMGHTSLDIICMLRQHSIDSDGDGNGDNALPLPRYTADWMVKQCGIPLSEAIKEDKYNVPVVHGALPGCEVDRYRDSIRSRGCGADADRRGRPAECPW
ncbi:hypothetical protein BDW68DRAFT_171603 [Aspergillus falconensis]